MTGRPKHYYSIYQKMIVRGRDFADIYDLVGVRVLVDSVRDCYAALGALHARWNPVPGRFKDYIAMPKFNLYQSLHTTVIGPGGKPVEIQIRTHDMHRRAEYGVAAHWKYKESAKNAGTTDKDSAGNDMQWLRQLVDWQKETADPSEFLDSLRFEIAGSEVYVFTPKGDVIGLPSGSTPVDFAYAVHTEVGHRTMGARVNGRLVPLDSSLENGDVVDVFTSKSETAGPSRDWLGFVKSPRARNKIRQWFSKERREEAIEHGKDAIAKAMRKQNLPIQRLLSHESLVALANEMRYADVSALYAAIGEGQVSAGTVVQRLVQSMGGEPAAEEDLAEVARPGQTQRRVRTGDPGVVVKGVDDIWVKLAKCCTPVPGDDIVGFVTRGAGVSVHRTRLHQRDEPALGARAHGRRRLEPQQHVAVPRADPGRGARPQPAALGRHPRAVRLAREHPLGVGLDVARPGRPVAVRVRDGRAVPPRVRARRGAQGRGRVRRLPHHRRQGGRGAGDPRLTVTGPRRRGVAPGGPRGAPGGRRGGPVLGWARSRRPAAPAASARPRPDGSIRAMSMPVRWTDVARWAPTRTTSDGGSVASAATRAGCGSVRRAAGPDQHLDPHAVGTGRCAPRPRVRRPTTPRAGTSAASAIARSSGVSARSAAMATSPQTTRTTPSRSSPNHAAAPTSSRLTVRGRTGTVVRNSSRRVLTAAA